jgi:hypothetical protein
MPQPAAGKPPLAGPVPFVPRLRLDPARSRGTLLDGGWWARSGDPAAELPGLIRAILQPAHLSALSNVVCSSMAPARKPHPSGL